MFSDEASLDIAAYGAARSLGYSEELGKGVLWGLSMNASKGLLPTQSEFAALALPDVVCCSEGADIAPVKQVDQA